MLNQLLLEMQGYLQRPLQLPGARADLAAGAAHAGIGPPGWQRSRQRSGMEWSMADFTSPDESLGTGTGTQRGEPGGFLGEPRGGTVGWGWALWPCSLTV